jgi:hypothetical protein
VRHNGYIQALVGTLAGAAVLGGVPAGLFALLRRCDPDAGFDCLGVAFVIAGLAIVGGTVGAVAGCYLALRRARQPAAALTSAALLPVAAVASAPLGLATQAFEFSSPALALIAAGALSLAALAAVPLGARWAALTLVHRRRSKSDGSSDILGSRP